MSSKLIKDTAIYGLGNMSQKGLSFLLVFLYTHFINPDQIGIINAVQVFSAVYVLFLSFGLERSIYRLYHDYVGEESKRRFLGTVNISIIVISLCVIGLTYSFRHKFDTLFRDIDFYPFIALGMVDAFLTVLTIVPKLLFQVKGQPWRFMMLTLGQSFFSVICICALLYNGYRSAEYVLLGGVVGFALFLPISAIVMVKNMAFQLDLGILINTLKFSIPLVPSVLSSWVINMSDRLFLEYYYTITDVGLYSVAYKIGQVVQLFATAILMAYNPFFFKLANQHEPDKEKMDKLHNGNISILLFLCFGVALLANDFIYFVLSEEYLEVSHIVPMVVAGYFFIQMTGLQNLSFQQTKKTLLLMQVSVLAAVVNIILNYLFISRWGMEGAAFATILTQLLFFIFTYIISTKVYFLRIEFNRLLPMAVFAFAITLLFYKLVEPGVLGSAIKMTLMFILFWMVFRKNIRSVIFKR